MKDQLLRPWGLGPTGREPNRGVFGEQARNFHVFRRGRDCADRSAVSDRGSERRWDTANRWRRPGDRCGDAFYNNTIEGNAINGNGLSGVTVSHLPRQFLDGNAINVFSGANTLIAVTTR